MYEHSTSNANETHAVDGDRVGTNRQDAEDKLGRRDKGPGRNNRRRNGIQPVRHQFEVFIGALGGVIRINSKLQSCSNIPETALRNQIAMPPLAPQNTYGGSGEASFDEFDKKIKSLLKS